LSPFWRAFGASKRKVKEGITPKPGVERAARRLGQKLILLRDRAGSNNLRQKFGRHYGFAYTFTKDEIEELGAEVNRTVVWEDDGTRFPHATLLAAPRGAKFEADAENGLLIGTGEVGG
jgi:hypothetical protein